MSGPGAECSDDLSGMSDYVPDLMFLADGDLFISASVTITLLTSQQEISSMSSQ